MATPGNQYGTPQNDPNRPIDRPAERPMATGGTTGGPYGASGGAYDRPGSDVGDPNTMPKRDSALKIGLIFGVLIFITTLILGFLLSQISTGLAGIFNLGTLVTMLMITGAIAARRFASAALSGLVAAVTNTILQVIAGLIGLTAGVATGGMPGLPDLSGDQAAIAITAVVIGLILGLAFAAAIGALFGWLGGLLFGKGRADSTYR